MGILVLLSTGVLGVFLGAQIVEAILFVPYWKALASDDFFEFHKTYGKKIHQFFAPLTIIATFLPLSMVVYGLINHSTEQVLLWIIGIATLSFFSTYFLYFKKANKSFGERSISNEALPTELIKWGNWHWGRIVFEFIAFSGCLILLLKL